MFSEKIFMPLILKKTRSGKMQRGSRDSVKLLVIIVLIFPQIFHSKFLCE